MDPVHDRGSMDPVHILIVPVHGAGPQRGSMDRGSMFCTFPFDSELLILEPWELQF